jgi:hypothetical protein
VIRIAGLFLMTWERMRANNSSNDSGAARASLPRTQTSLLGLETNNHFIGGEISRC